MRYKYCPECGEKLIDQIAGDEGKVPYCHTCQCYWFDSFSSCSIVMVVNEYHEIALLRQKYLSQQYMSFVSGYIAPGESAEETAIREVYEEIGIEIKRLEYAGTYWFDDKDILMHGFIGYALKKEFKVSKEVDHVEWVPYDQIEDKIFPDRKGNAMHPIYRQYVKENHNGSIHECKRY